MALFVPGPLVSVISGRVGGSVFFRGVGGPAIRSYAVPVNTVSSYKTFIQGITTTLSQAYGALSAGNKTAWSTWAATHPQSNRIGQQITLQANAAFMKLNHIILELGAPQIDVPPIDTPPTVVSGQAIVAAETGQSVSVSWTSGAVGANEHVIVWIALLDSLGVTNYSNRLRLVQYGGGAGVTPADVAAEVIARFGTLIAGQAIKCEIEVWDDLTGLRSATVFTEAIVGA